jgi:glycosyltransferase involved in cell wall biosynthesis
MPFSIQAPAGRNTQTASTEGDRGESVAFISTVPQTLWYFARPHWRGLTKEGYKIIAISSPGSFLDRCLEQGADCTFAIDLQRAITPLSDLSAALRLTFLLGRLRPKLIHSHTPKAGLIGMMAAAAVRVPIRIYTFNGAVWLVGPRWKRALLRLADRIACSLATDVVCVSQSLRSAVIEARVCRARKAIVLGPGSSHGVDTQLFDPNRVRVEDRERLRQECGISAGHRVLGFVGRITPDKGIHELYGSWQVLRREFPDLHLVLCGPVETGRGAAGEIARGLDADARVKRIAIPHREMPLLYSLMDVCALPSHREGFPNVMLEAGCMCVPVVTTTAVGCRDAVIDGVTGILVPPRDTASLTSAISILLQSQSLRQRLGNAARLRAISEFSESAVCARFFEHYQELLSRR